MGGWAASSGSADMTNQRGLNNLTVFRGVQDSDGPVNLLLAVID